MTTSLSLLPRAVRAIFFDAVGTLIHPEPAAGTIYATVGRRFGSRLDPTAVTTRFRTAFRREEEWDRRCHFRTDEEREVQRWRQIVAEVLDDVSDGEACFQELFAHFSRPEAWRCDPDAADVLTELVRRGYVLGLASNYDRRLRSVTAGLPSLRPVQHLVISSEVGWRKPAAGFFEALCRTAGLPAAQVALVGDDWDNDYEGGQAAGLSVVLFDPQARATAADARVICRLSELLR